MASKLCEYLTLLATEARVLHEFQHNLREALAQSGLSEQEQSMIERRDAREIRRAIYNDLSEHHRDVLIYVSVSGPPPPQSLSSR